MTSARQCVQFYLNKFNFSLQQSVCCLVHLNMSRVWPFLSSSTHANTPSSKRCASYPYWSKRH